MDCLPLYFGVRRIFRMNQNVLSLACEKWEIGARCERMDPAAIFHEEELTRIQAYQADTTRDNEHRRIRGGLTVHDASTMYRLKNVVIRDGYAYCAGSRMQMNGLTQGPSIRMGWPTRESKAMLVGFAMTAKYFGHWLNDQLPLEVTAGELGIKALAVPRDFPFSHEPGYRQLTQLRCVVTQWCRVDDLYYAVDYAQNQYKHQRYIELRERILKCATPIKNNGVLILRKHQGVSRVLQNEPEIADDLASMGFTIIDPQRHSVSEIINAISQTPLVISVEGSALCHAVFSIPLTSTIMAIQPPRRFNNVVKDYTDCLGIRYAFTVADPIDKDSFFLPLDRLHKAIDLVSSQTERKRSF